LEIDEILEEIKKEDITLRYRLMKKKGIDVKKLTKEQFFKAMTMVRAPEKAIMLKERCEGKDDAACVALEGWVEGDPESPMYEKRIGLRGLWEKEDNIFAGEILVKLGELSEEEFKKKAEGEKREEKPKEKPEKLKEELEELKRKEKEIAEARAEIERKMEELLKK